MINSIFFISFLGLFIGSFLNVLIDRIPFGLNVISDRSSCDYCKKSLRWFELIPIFSFLLQRGRCRRCHKRLSYQYPLMEVVTGAMFGLVAYFTLPDWFATIWYLVIFSCLLVIFLIDFKHYVIPDSMLVVAIIASAVLLLRTPQVIVTHMISAFGACLFIYAIWYFSRGKGMGFGDVKFAFFLGFSLGFPEIVVALYAAFLTGALVGIILILGRQKSLKSKIPFGPFLIAGYCCSFFLTQPVLRLFNI